MNRCLVPPKKPQTKTSNRLSAKSASTYSIDSRSTGRLGEETIRLLVLANVPLVIHRRNGPVRSQIAVPAFENVSVLLRLLQVAALEGVNRVLQLLQLFLERLAM